MPICTEVCWALRNLAHTEGNRERLANELVPETLAAVLKTHLNTEVGGSCAVWFVGNVMSLLRCLRLGGGVIIFVTLTRVVVWSLSFC